MITKLRKSLMGSSRQSHEDDANRAESDAGNSASFEPLLDHDRSGERSDVSRDIPSQGPRSYDSTTPRLESNLTQRSRSPIDMDPFWVPPFSTQSNHKSNEDAIQNKPYCIISVPDTPKPKHAWRAPRPFIVYDYLLSILLVYGGIALIHPSLEKDTSLRTLLGAILFQAGLVAAIVVLYTIFSTCGRRGLQYQDWLIVLTIGLSIYLTRTLDKPWTLPLFSKRTSWELFFGAGLLEAVLIHLISRGLFLVPNKDDAIIMLQRQVASWEDSIAIGLADQYYADYCRPAGRIVQAHHENRLDVAYQNDDRVYTDSMDVSCIFVAAPRRIDWHQDSFVRQAKENYQQNGLLLPCWIGPNASLQFEQNTSPMSNWLCVSGFKQGYVVDAVPAPLQYILDNIRRGLDIYTCDEERSEQYRNELRRFTQRLAWLAQRDDLGKYVVIVEFDRDVMGHLPSACSDVFRRLDHVAHWDGEERNDSYSYQQQGGSRSQMSPV